MKSLIEDQRPRPLGKDPDPATLPLDALPKGYLAKVIDESEGDIGAWRFLRAAVGEYRRQCVPIPSELMDWALGVAEGKRAEPKRPNHRPSKERRDLVFFITLERLRRHHYNSLEEAAATVAQRVIEDKLDPNIKNAEGILAARKRHLRRGQK